MKALRLKVLTAFAFAILLSAIAPNLLMAQDLAEFTVEDLSGKVLMLASGSSSWTPVEAGMKLSAGDTLKTESDSFVQIGAKGVGVFSLGQKAQMIINKISVQQTDVNAELELKLGDLKGKLAKMKAGSNFQVKTPTSVAAVRGTEFLISVVVNVAGQIETLYFVFSGNLSVTALSDGSLVAVTAEQAQKITTTGATAISKDSSEYAALEQIFADLAAQEFQTSDIEIESITIEEAQDLDDPIRDTSPST